MPVKYWIGFGEPLHLEGTGDEEDADIAELVDEIRDGIRAQLDEGRAQRQGIFRG